MLCTNRFRSLCRQQLESGKAFELFFDANDWAALYSEFDEESAEDDENLFDQFASSLSEGDSLRKSMEDDDEDDDEEEEDGLEDEETNSPPPPPKQRRTRKKRVKVAEPAPPKRKRRSRKASANVEEAVEELLTA